MSKSGSEYPVRSAKNYPGLLIWEKLSRVYKIIQLYKVGAALLHRVAHLGNSLRRSISVRSKIKHTIYRIILSKSGLTWQSGEKQLLKLYDLTQRKTIFLFYNFDFKTEIKTNVGNNMMFFDYLFVAGLINLQFLKIYITWIYLIYISHGFIFKIIFGGDGRELRIKRPFPLLIQARLLMINYAWIFTYHKLSQ